MQWWECVVDGHTRVDTKLIEPENSQLHDLDPETRASVEKMMVEQQQKRMQENAATATASPMQMPHDLLNSISTSDDDSDAPALSEAERQQMLQRFMASHPELDFSRAKITL